MEKNILVVDEAVEVLEDFQRQGIRNTVINELLDKLRN